MADGSKNDGLSAPAESSDSRTTAAAKHCCACCVPVKEHAGPHGPSKCLLGRLNALEQRIELLEADASRRELEFGELESLHLKRQEGRLAQIEALDERVQQLESEKSSLCNALESARSGHAD